jgi:hypothetical protein
MKMFSWATCLKRLPSEYFRDNVWVSIDPDEATTEAMATLLGADERRPLARSVVNAKVRPRIRLTAFTVLGKQAG